MDDTIASLRRSIRRLQLVTGGLTFVTLAAGLSAFRAQAPTVLRARGIIIEDAQGRERILIGAPVPYAKNRVRTDTARVRQAWSNRYPDPNQYMGFYATYRNGTNGMIVLDERGFDRLAVGDSVPDPNIGKRIGPSDGIVINDSAGFERTGYGLLKVSKYRVSLGMDSERGEEGIGLMLDDAAQIVGLFGKSRDRSLFLGNDIGAASPALASEAFGLTLRKGQSITKSIDASKP
jgi:hypothetical protein